MRTLVIGSEGNVGRILVPYLKRKMHTVYRMDQVYGYADDYSIANIMNPPDMEEVFSSFKPDVVYLLAAVVGRLVTERSRSLAIQVNVAGTSNVAYLCRLYSSRLVYFSTSEVYGDCEGDFHETDTPLPNNFYGLTKYMAEQVLAYERTKGLDVIIVRPFMLYHEMEDFGEHRSMMIRSAKAIFENRHIEVYKDSVRAWLHMDDFVRILEEVSKSDFDIVNIGSSEFMKIQDIIKFMCDYAGRSYDELVTEVSMPGHMIFIKKPNLSRQWQVYKNGLISNFTGVCMVMDAVKERLS